ncbi:hypothetical protein Pan54_12890 [Rubinisphaera italica]|uniref:Uncharacterized protein n=1 Tax=Rubinisphaera italica TaxID=2527969 RepID=A0A5C5XEN2_9PLAN|nr:hypothetical protein Pan54_12890 [Rubinisphaera italica]
MDIKWFKTLSLLLPNAAGVFEYALDPLCVMLARHVDYVSLEFFQRQTCVPITVPLKSPPHIAERYKCLEEYCGTGFEIKFQFSTK